MSDLSLTDITLPIIIGLLTFFANRVMGIFKMVTELHKWHSKTDDTGAFMWYSQSKRVADTLDSIKQHIEEEEKNLRDLAYEVKALKAKLNGK